MRPRSSSTASPASSRSTSAPGRREAAPVGIHRAPATLDLAFPEAVEVSEIHLTFDSGFQRELILSLSDHHTAKSLRGAQPELVKAYRIYLDGELVVSEDANYLRKRVHRLAAPRRGSVLRIEVLATHGAPEARLFEVRVY